jgi:uncharacterized protein YacL
MSHFPVDHPLRGLYRGLAFLIGLAIIAFGVVAYIQTSSYPFFGPDGERVLGLTANPGFAVLSVVVGLAITVVTLIGRNLDVAVNIVMGGGFILVGLVMLALLRTPLNFLAFSVTNVVVSFIIGLVLILAGLYGSVSRRSNAADIGSRASEEIAAH